MSDGRVDTARSGEYNFDNYCGDSCNGNGSYFLGGSGGSGNDGCLCICTEVDPHLRMTMLTMEQLCDQREPFVPAVQAEHRQHEATVVDTPLPFVE